MGGAHEDNSRTHPAILLAGTNVVPMRTIAGCILLMFSWAPPQSLPKVSPKPPRLPPDFRRTSPESPEPYFKKKRKKVNMFANYLPILVIFKADSIRSLCPPDAIWLLCTIDFSVSERGQNVKKNTFSSDPI